MNTIISFLKQLELSETEAKLYLTLLQTGSISVRELASHTKIKRTTAYLYVDQLVDKGLVIKIVKGSRKQVEANPPESLKHLVEKKVTSAKDASSILPNVMGIIESRLPKAIEQTDAEIKYYKGKLGVKKIYDEALKSSELRLYANIADLATLLIPNDIDLDFAMFDRALINNKELKIFEIISDDPDSIKSYALNDTAENGRYNYKFMPKKVGLTAPGILLYDNTVAIITGGETVNSIVLYNTEYYVNSVKLFDFIWDVLPSPKD